MKRIILSFTLIILVGGAVTFGVTKAFFSDTETSTANVLAAGAIDLLIDNESYYNGEFNEDTSWGPTNLTTQKFFDFLDLKPDDYGEDTISIHVDTNDAYLCANVTLTSNNENGCTEPESGEDDTCDDPGPDQGELADLVEFIWWADDGDNVLEVGENVISQGAIGALELNVPYPLALADSDENIWGGVGPIDGDTTYYIGKAWCFGNITPAPLESDTYDAPSDNNGGTSVAGEPEDGGFTCDGIALGNESQTDSLTADISFEAVQARHNSTFQCEVPQSPGTTLTLVKEVLGNDAASSWTLSASGPTNISGLTGSADVTNASVDPGIYDLSESSFGPYTGSNWNCVGGTQNDADTVTIAEGQHVTCTVTNYISCQPTEQYADTVVTTAQGLRKDGTAVLLERSNASSSLGAPQSSGLPSDPAVPAGSFYSLGFGGSIVVRFDNNYIIDGPGNDLQVWEVTGGVYPDELIELEASQDGTTWFPIGSGLTRDAMTDLGLSGLSWARYIRLTDISNPNSFSDATADGYDLDAFSALTCGTRTVQQ
jgi:hypothetical protein